MPTTFAFYLSNGAVDVAAAVGVVLVIVQVTKGWVIDSWMKPTTTAHDYVVQTYDVLLSLLVVAFLMWAGPGEHTKTDWAVTMLGTILTAASTFGIYGAIRGPVPHTPTTAYQEAQRRLLAVLDRPRTVVSRAHDQEKQVSGGSAVGQEHRQSTPAGATLGQTTTRGATVEYGPGQQTETRSSAPPFDVLRQHLTSPDQEHEAE